MKKTVKNIKLIVGQRSICARKKSLIVSDKIIQAEVLGDFFKKFSKKGLNVSEKIAKK